MVEKTTSAVAEILRAADLFQSAKQQQFKAIGVLFEVYLRAKSNPDVQKELRSAFEALDSKQKPKKCKTLTGITSWLAFPHSKQRVSDAHKLLDAAPDTLKSADDFANWIETNGGIRATLLSLSKPRNVASAGTKSKPLGEVCHDAVSGLAEHIDANVRYEAQNPVCHRLADGQMHIQITEYVNGKYKVLDALLLGGELKFPQPQAPTVQKQRPIAPLGDLAKLAHSSSAKSKRTASSAS